MWAVLLKAVAPTLVKFGLGFLVRDEKARLAALEEREKIRDKADEKRDDDIKDRMEATRDARSGGDAADRLRRKYKRK